MANLKQTSEISYYQGWYGTCTNSDECIDLPLIQGTGASSAKIYPEIHKIYEIRNDAEGILNYDGETQDGFALSFTPLKSLKCGKCYRIVLSAGTGSVNLPQFSYANEANDDTEQNISNRITDNCDSGGGGTGDYSFEVVSAITDVLDEGYINTDATAFDAEAHTSIIADANGVDEITMQSDGNGLEYTMDGSSWSDLGTSVKTISSDFTNLQLRVKTGLTTGTYNRVITFTAKPTNPAFISLNKSLSYNITVNNVSISASKIITEELEEGTSGAIHSFDITFENLDGIGITTDTTLHRISASQNGNFGNGISIPNPSSSPVTIYVKLHGNMPSSDVTTMFTVIGDRRNSGANINLDDAITITSTVAPRPQITSLSVNSNNLGVAITFSNKNNYGGHHWHYMVENKDAIGIMVVNTQMPAFTDNVTLNQDDFTDAGTYVLTAFIVTSGHQPIAGSDTKTAEFTIAGNNASLSVNPSSVNEILDVDETQATHTINISSNNLTNVTYTPSLNNWEFLNTISGSTGTSSFAIKLKDSVKSTDVSSGPVDLPQEIITITGDVGARDTSGDAQKSVTLPLNAKLMDKSEFTITGANLNVTDNRDWGEFFQVFGPYTLTFDAVTLTSNSLNNWQVELGNDGGNWVKSPDFSSVPSGTTFKVRNAAGDPGTYNETLTITPTASASDHDSSNDPSAITLNLNSTISALSANLVNPGTQTLSAITSGETPSSKTFVVSGTKIENISISDVSAGWSVTPANPSLGSTVTISYTDDATSVGTKTGTFKISADPIHGSTLSTTEYTVNMSLIVNNKVSSISANPSNVTLNNITTGDASDSKTTSVSSSNVGDITITNIPSGFLVKNGSTTLSQNDSIGTNATLTISLSNVNSLGTRSGTINLEGTPSANSSFNGSAIYSITVEGQVDGLATSLSISPTTVTDDLDQNDVAVAHEIALTYDNLSSISISGGNANKYRVSATENGTYSNTLSLDPTATNFFVKLMNTSSAGSISTNFSISGTKSATGTSNPSNKTLSCSGIVNAVVTPTPAPAPTPTPTPIPVAGPSTLWLAFSENGNTSGKYSPFYELKNSESSAESFSGIPNDNITAWGTNFVPIGGGLEAITDTTTFDQDKHVFRNSGLVFTALGGTNPGVPTQLASAFDDPEVMVSALHGAEIVKVPGALAFLPPSWTINVNIALDHTKFEFVNPDHETEITSWMTSSSTTNLVEVLITESPTPPNIDSLSTTEIASAFNSPSLSLKCGDTWNGDLSSNKTKLVIVRDNGGIPEPFNYGALGSSVPILNSGKWNGAGTAFMNNNALTTVKSPKIMYFYFEKSSSGTKVKFSDGNPSSSHCGIS